MAKKKNTYSTEEKVVATESVVEVQEEVLVSTEMSSEDEEKETAPKEAEKPVEKVTEETVERMTFSAEDIAKPMVDVAIEEPKQEEPQPSEEPKQEEQKPSEEKPAEKKPCPNCKRNAPRLTQSDKRNNVMMRWNGWSY